MSFCNINPYPLAAPMSFVNLDHILYLRFSVAFCLWVKVHLYVVPPYAWEFDNFEGAPSVRQFSNKTAFN